MSVAIIIPARGGSVGIPRKNLQQIGGESLIARAVRTCLESDAGPVFVSTEDCEIASAAFEAGAAVINRPAGMATSKATTDRVLMHAAQLLLADTLALVQCTSPTMTPGEITGTIEALEAGDAPLAIAVCEDNAVLIEDAGGRRVGVGFDLADPVTLRQAKCHRYAILGSVWALNRVRFLERARTYCENPTLHVVDRPRLDIDTPADLELARRVLAPNYQAPSPWAHAAAYPD